jgi:UDP-2,3-diacylglucosamine pyrophosphatase LpxH
VSDGPSLVIVSDLHLGGGPAAGAWGAGFSDEFADDRPFSDFLRWLARRPGSRLVFLGDTFDFLRVPVTGTRMGLFARCDAEAVAQLDQIAAAHSTMITALSAALAEGLRADFVCGNHDAELVRPAVRERLCALLGAHVRVHPWILYIPGLLYAEHGHQHHDINAFACPLYPYAANGGCLERPPAARLGDFKRLPASPGPLWRDALSGLRGRRPAASRAEYLTRFVPAGAHEIGLPQSVVAELHHLASFSVVRTGRRLASTRSRRVSRPGYLPLAAAAVHDLMARSQCAVPFYAFGHTHAAARISLGANACYLNSGTWSTAAWAGDGSRRTWIELATAAPTSAKLFRWAGAAEPLVDRTVPA